MDKHDKDPWGLTELLACLVFCSCLGALYYYSTRDHYLLGTGLFIGIAGFSSAHRLFAKEWPWQSWDKWED